LFLTQLFGLIKRGAAPKISQRPRKNAEQAFTKHVGLAVLASMKVSGSTVQTTTKKIAAPPEPKIGFRACAAG
jgi:hypothetical protein